MSTTTERKPYRAGRGYPALFHPCPACGVDAYVKPGRKPGCCSSECRRIHRANTVRKMTEPEKAWLAGILDGEGCIRVEWHGVAPCSRVVVVNTHMPLLERCAEFTGVGRIYNRQRQATHHKASFCWVVQGVQASAVLVQVIPWLQEKKERAEVAMRHHNLEGSSH